MKSFNQIELIGHLGQKPELKYTQSQVAFCNLSIATNTTYQSAKGENHEQTEWHRCTAWRKLAEICAEHLDKGSHVFVSGKLTYHEWSKDGIKHRDAEIMLDEMLMLEPKKEVAPAAEKLPV